MTSFFNSISRNRENPNLILCDQGLFELYESFSQQSTQLVKEADTHLADLGYTVLRFKGQRMVWSEDATTDHMLFLNTNHVEVVYDPTLWFEMTGFKPIALQGERIAHILLAMNVVSGQLRRHGRLHYTNT